MNFTERIEDFNRMYSLPVSQKPTIDLGEEGAKRLDNFCFIIRDEVNEGWDIVGKMEDGHFKTEEEALTELADWFGDMVVYVFSEAAKYGIPMWAVLKIIMDSNESKLGEDGKPIKDGFGKVLKGPNYWKPEPKILEVIKECRK